MDRDAVTEPLRLELSFTGDLPLRVGLIQGDAACWKMLTSRLDPRRYVTPEEAEDIVGNTLVRIAAIVETMNYHPRQCAYAAALVERKAMPIEWGMRVLEYTEDPDAVYWASEMKRLGAPREWARDFILGRISDDEKVRRLYELVMVGIITATEAEAIVEGLEHGRGRAAVSLAEAKASSFGWAMKIVLEDLESRQDNIERLKELAGNGAPKQGSSQTQAKKARRQMR